MENTRYLCPASNDLLLSSAEVDASEKLIAPSIDGKFLLERDAKQLKHKAILWLENDPLLLGGSKRSIRRDEDPQPLWSRAKLEGAASFQTSFFRPSASAADIFSSPLPPGDRVCQVGVRPLQLLQCIVDEHDWAQRAGQIEVVPGGDTPDVCIIMAYALSGQLVELPVDGGAENWEQVRFVREDPHLQAKQNT
ncbi:hypothetical protein U0070_001288 [Myodes glareolus]|uniref:Uncharacterized protein n=1 Tax=Myodes glareolus TaxID=447135 RepID=A0AAW0I3L1_MYOGA